MRALDQQGSTCSIISADFAKAFNSISHQAIIESLRLHGASSHSQKMISTFQQKRMMVFKVNDSLSSMRELRGGAPQGTILGNFLFVMTTNKIENQINITVQDARTSQDPVPSMPMTPERLTFNPLNNPDLVSMPTTQDNLRYSSHQLPKTRMTVSIFWTECNEYGRIWILLKLGSWGPFPWSRSSSRQPPRTLSNL